MLVADLHHFLDLPADTPGPARRLGRAPEQHRRAATAGDAGHHLGKRAAVPTPTGQPPLPGPDHRALHPAGGADPAGSAAVCGDDGVISNWAESPFDLRRQRLALADPVHEIVIGAEIAATLRDLAIPRHRLRASSIRHPSRQRRRHPRRHRRRPRRADRGRGRRGQPRTQPAPPTTTRRRIRARSTPRPTHRRLVNRWPCRIWTSHECNGGAPRGCPSTPATKSASNAQVAPTTPHDRRAARPLARGLRPGMDQLPDRPSALHRRRQVPGPCTGATATCASTSTTR